MITMQRSLFRLVLDRSSLTLILHCLFQYLPKAEGERGPMNIRQIYAFDQDPLPVSASPHLFSLFGFHGMPWSS